MKKKIFVIFALLLVALLLFVSCDNGSDLQKMNDMLKLDYSKVQIIVNVTSQTEHYNGKFTLTYGVETTIEYQIEQVNTFEIGDDGSIATPEDGFIVSKNGVVVVRDGEIVDGDVEVEFPDELGIYTGGFSFKQAFFTNVSNKGARFEADVVDAQNFTGSTTLVCTDMHVAVVRNLNSNCLTSLELTYVAGNGSDVAISYVFTK